MSADDVLAAQLWPWPDPIIKRDHQGAVIFVNAAFLQIYGGQVTDWHGCAVDGWHTPMAGYEPNRFETRMPSASGDVIYDWLEYVMADGCGLAISRNVTALLNRTPPTDPALAPLEHMGEAQPMEHMPLSAADTHDYEPVPPQAVLPVHTATLDIAPESPENHAPQEDTYVEAAHVEPQAIAPVMDIPVDMEPVADVAPQVDTPVEAERDHVRRALPIEDEKSLLGDNWRDAVIAKAVGSDVADISAPMENNVEEMQDASPIEAAPLSLQVKPNDNAGAVRILLAEDNAINALLTRTLLEADGCYVEVVEDGNLAVEAMRKETYDMILMDMRMPNMDGLEATRKIRGLSNEAKAIPIVALTANAFDDDRNACFDAGMNDFMTKPVSAEELQQMVQTWTKSSQTQAA